MIDSMTRSATRVGRQDDPNLPIGRRSQRRQRRVSSVPDESGQRGYRAPDIAQLYRARWEIELLFKELKSQFGLDEINTTDAYIIEALIIMAALAADEPGYCPRTPETGRKTARLRRRRRGVVDAASRRRCSHAVERHAHLIQLYLMLDLGYELPDLDSLLLWSSRDPNPHRPRLREQVESGEFW
ncbi:hypothetical protein D8S78_20090 [Natrialba swarupiae]|nr:hypothetical protein [Natrialba swarupiae]